jgi:hypothetical protein
MTNTLAYYTWVLSGSSVVEHLPRHLKVKGLSPACTWAEIMVTKSVFNILRIQIIINVIITHAD